MQMMTDKFVTVQTFHQSFEAQLAKNLLETEGIDAMLSGELTADMLPLGQAGGSDQIVLQVHEDDAQRAAGVLAVVAAAKLDADWEEQAESGADVWICSICGEPISNGLSICYSCETPREGIRAGTPRDRQAIQQQPATPPTGEEVQKRDEITHTESPPPVAAPAPLEPGERADVSEEADSAAVGDDLARHAFGAAFLGILTVLLLPISWYYLLRLMFFPGELSPRGMRYLYGALLINGLFFLVVLGFWISGVLWI
jgi:hypothetical protein